MNASSRIRPDNAAIRQRAARAQTIAAYRADRVLAHRELFAKRHPLATCAAQEDAIREFHDARYPRTIIEAFRGFAKTTLGEEGILVKAALLEYSYAMIVCNTYSMAVKRLSAIKREIFRNRELRALFGDLRGPVWREDHIELRNGVVIEVVGARQSMRGAKEGETRPDFMLIDDLEDPDWVRDPDAIEANKSWFMGALLPGLADQLRTPIRWIGTPLSDNCLLNQFKRMSEWRSRIYPVKFLNAAEEWQATWPAKHPLEDIERIERSYIEAGNHREFVQEYMCESESRTEVLFRREMFHYDASRVRTYQALYAMVDPARTTKKNSAMTGWAVWSWDPGARLTIWEANGGYLKPDEVVSLLFDLQERWGLVEIGIEEDGLNEWAMQPIRDAQTRRGVIPVRPMRAPRGKIDFIRGLQPYFSATRNVTMVGGEAEFRTLTQQLMAFPRDLMDVPNALAYALLMRPGEVVFPDFSPEAIFEDEAPLPMEPLYLAMNADGQRVTGVLLQEARGVVRVFADLVADGQPGDIAADIIREAIRFAGAETRNGRAISRVRVVVGPQHGETYRNHGLVQAVARATGQAPVFGVQAAEVGRQAVREALQRRVRGVPGLMVSSDAAWVLRGLTGGFAYAVEKNGGNAQEPLKGVYRTLLEGLESGVGMANLASQADDAPGSFRTTDDGRRYRTALRR